MKIALGMCRRHDYCGGDLYVVIICRVHTSCYMCNTHRYVYCTQRRGGSKMVLEYIARITSNYKCGG